MSVASIILGAVLAVSLATNVIIVWWVRAFWHGAKTDPNAFLGSFFRNATTYRGHVLRIDEHGKVTVTCEHHYDATAPCKLPRVVE